MGTVSDVNQGNFVGNDFGDDASIITSNSISNFPEFQVRSCCDAINRALSEINVALLAFTGDPVQGQRLFRIVENALQQLSSLKCASTCCASAAMSFADLFTAALTALLTSDFATVSSRLRSAIDSILRNLRSQSRSCKKVCDSKQSDHKKLCAKC